MTDPIETPVVPPVETPVAAEAVPPVETPAEETVSKAEFEKVLAEMHKYKGEARDLTSASAAEKEQLLRAGGKWEEIATLKSKELEDANTRYTAIQKSLVDNKKFSALKDAAMKAGVRPEAMTDLELVSMDSLQVETTSTGRVNVLGVQAEIDRIKLTRPHWFGGAKTTINGGIPSVNNPGGLVTKEELIKLSVEAQKSGDYTAYHAKTKQYQTQ